MKFWHSETSFIFNTIIWIRFNQEIKIGLSNIKDLIPFTSMTFNPDGKS